jgi:hypothetical protein
MVIPGRQVSNPDDHRKGLAQLVEPPLAALLLDRLGPSEPGQELALGRLGWQL